MEGLIILLFIIGIVAVVSSHGSKQTPSQGIMVNTNEINYPAEIHCPNCKERVRPTIKSIDSSTWDLICDCGATAYLHPKREERKEQLDWLLEQCRND